MAYHPELQGELAVVPRSLKHQMVLGVVLGAAIAALFVFSIFGLVIRSLSYPDPWLLLGLVTFGGILAGAIFGPIIAMIFRKRTIRKFGL